MEKIADVNNLRFRLSSMSLSTCSSAIYYCIYYFTFISKYKCKTLYQKNGPFFINNLFKYYKTTLFIQYSPCGERKQLKTFPYVLI